MNQTRTGPTTVAAGPTIGEAGSSGRSPSTAARRFGRTGFIIGAGALVTLAVAAWAVVAGSAGIGLGDLADSLWWGLTRAPGRAADPSYQIVWRLRLPRVVLGLVAGAALSVSGVVMQGLLRNPLVSPYTLGISPAAAFGASLVILLSDNQGGHISVPVVAAALLGALLCSAVVLSLSSFHSMSVVTLILFGVALTQLFSALTSGLQYFADEDRLAAMVRWTFGSVNDATWAQAVIVGGALVLVLPLFMVKAKDLNAIAFLGDDTALSLGVSVTRTRVLLIMLSVLLTSIVVSFVGVIGFVGLVGPHIARLLIGSNHRALIPFSALTGAILLVFSDTIGRIVLSPTVVPVGIVVSIIGAPLFIYLVLNQRNRNLG
ncbi:FecCD family ABC transporter permease [Actinacidiphila sp. ITFR-21]|uniref:FecCD family ABC transporter permease n=1 Tax=Actinacidiphila sp. ITFR-21 TaxID=3075199 RepID=UPI00288AB9A1|nr:iron ABC transporter permease [Streptomyces sp. ITFR-21]WNI18045.1 iron ABC transporter permease [Streptomyces sp. ITFR-21]